MTTGEEELYAPYQTPATATEEIEPYRTVSRSAVISVGVGVLALLGFSFPSLLPLAMLGIVLALTSLTTIRRYPNEYTGKKIALAGLLLSAFTLLVATPWHIYEYMTEVPENHVRISFSDLQPDPEVPELMIPPKAADLSGKQVFIKGYMHPGVSSTGKVMHFILVPDMGTCCFGGQPKMTDMIEIKVTDPTQSIAYSTRRMKLAGTFKLSYPQAKLGLKDVCYSLDASMVKK
ncbi:hypothetical protein Psta_2111 [Pirellula staleyi DSM 6068]|uniref:DUF3299 domain-containing protein n=1 Tax=Pirellula staleyi (strain ATCC 27377 / DSM 6068 / ICPB 4128) TaxID=530564 RepID=D2R1R6_PIRSD|nr:DUF3299 domain-containing protein [Pirellula staleyi]ADB16785.1 hypothetical protein Psta_2111 [Pirellula staleyi DSM 6068]